MTTRDKVRLARRLRREGYKTSLAQRREILAKVAGLDDYCVVCRQDKGHRRAYGYGDKPNPIAFGRTYDITEQNGVLAFNSPPLVVSY